MKDFKQLLQRAQKQGAKKLAVAFAQDEDVLSAVSQAAKIGIASGYLVGKTEEIKEIAARIGFDMKGFEIVEEPDPQQAAVKAVGLVSSGKADALMKGLVDTGIILKAALDKECGLRTGSILSHVAAFDLQHYHKLLLVTDAAMNMDLSLETKAALIKNALEVTDALKIENPSVAVIAAKEKVTESMQATVDAAALVDMNKKGEITGCTVRGPYALDNAVSLDAAKTKGIKDPEAGDIDLLIMPNLEAGNVLYKALGFLAGATGAGVIVGAKAPIILTSRADSDDTKLYSIALAALISHR